MRTRVQSWIRVRIATCPVLTGTGHKLLPNIYWHLDTLSSVTFMKYRSNHWVPIMRTWTVVHFICCYSANKKHQCPYSTHLVYWFRFVPTRTTGIYHTGMKIGTIIPLIPPRIKFQPISGCFGQFRLVPNFGLKFFFFSYLLLLVGFEPIFFFLFFSCVLYR